MAKDSDTMDSSDGTQQDLTLRAFINRVQAIRELKQISGANWDLEIGAITEVSSSLSESKALLFDNIVGYPKGFRVITNATGSQKRSALALGIDPQVSGLQLVKAVRDKLEHLQLIPPKNVADG